MRATACSSSLISGWFAAALQVLIFLNDPAAIPCSSAALADQVRTHAVSLRRMMSPLVRAGIVEAREGRDGGYRLICPLEAISLGDVYRALRTDTASDASQGDVSWSGLLPTGTRLALDEVATEVEQQVMQALDRFTVAGVASRARERSCM
jgi:Rrf2 family transcriptional regulator, repressor of oqxAB